MRTTTLGEQAEDKAKSQRTRKIRIEKGTASVGHDTREDMQEVMAKSQRMRKEGEENKETASV